MCTNFLLNGNVMKKDVSFVEVYGKVNYTVNDNWQFGLNEYYSPNFLNSGAWGNYTSITGKYIARARSSAPAASASMFRRIRSPVAWNV